MVGFDAISRLTLLLYDIRFAFFIIIVAEKPFLYTQRLRPDTAGRVAGGGMVLHTGYHLIAIAMLAKEITYNPVCTSTRNHTSMLRHPTKFPEPKTNLMQHYHFEPSAPNRPPYTYPYIPHQPRVKNSLQASTPLGSLPPLPPLQLPRHFRRPQQSFLRRNEKLVRQRLPLLIPH